MFEVVTTGKNPNYGQKGQVRQLADNHLIVALKNGWIEKEFKYLGQILTKEEKKRRLNKIIRPLRVIDVVRTLEAQNKALGRQLQKTKDLIKVNKELIRLVTEDKEKVLNKSKI